MTPRWYERPPMEPVVVQGSFRAYGHTIGPAQRDLERWVEGGTLTPGLAPYYDPESDFKGYLQLDGRTIPGCRGIHWSLSWAQHRNPDSYGWLIGAGSAEDAFASACEMIREDEAERLLHAAVPGLA